MKDFIIAIVIGLLLGWSIVFFMKSMEKSYKQGQIDAITGKVNYKLVINPDSTKTWEEIK